MSEQMELFRTLEKDLNFELAPCDRNFDLDAKSGLTKLELTPAQKGKVSALFSQMPAMLASETMAHAYVLKLPEGLSGMNSLMSYRSGGLGTPITCFFAWCFRPSFASQLLYCNVDCFRTIFSYPDS